MCAHSNHNAAAPDASSSTSIAIGRADGSAATMTPKATPAATDANHALLVIAGAGSGKTSTLAHRVVHLTVNGADPRRIL